MLAHSTASLTFYQELQASEILPYLETSLPVSWMLSEHTIYGQLTVKDVGFMISEEELASGPESKTALKK